MIDRLRRGLAWLASEPGAVPAILAVALGLRILVMFALPQQPTSDSAWYLLRAQEMAAGRGYQEAGFPTAFWPVGYPALLAASMTVFGPSLVGPLLLNLIGAAATVWLILWFARYLGAGEAAARLAALAYAVYPAPVAYTGLPASEVTSTAIAMVGFALLVAGRRRWAWLFGAGLVFGIATLMRAQMMLFPIGVIVALAIVYRDFRWKAAARALILVHLSLAAVVIPWTIRNLHALGSAVPVSTNGGIALYYGANDRATGGWYAWERTPIWDEVMPIPYRNRVERQVDLDREFKAMARRWIAEHPGRWAALGVKKAALLWAQDADAFWALHATYPARARWWLATRLANQLVYMALLLVGLIGLARAVGAGRRGDARHAPLMLLGCMPAFSTLTAMGFTGQTRYHFPAMPFLVIAASWMVAQWLRPQPDAQA